VAHHTSEYFDPYFGFEYLVIEIASYFSSPEIKTNPQDLIERVL
jgi:hypothetical protein